ncbi:hypothetical protein GIB67_015863 [Kingdonia uniflora]|uniref:Uncharacterized protein n=1 Tax=Kingdonia uniflora TaxID=39325 RepID=A0A7J7NEW7_9MAGN|nr:hypothetical protein GIB67_015863 [Kingdonia uniflora]
MSSPRHREDWGILPRNAGYFPKRALYGAAMPYGVDGLCLRLSEQIRVMIPELVVWDTYLAVVIPKAAKQDEGFISKREIAQVKCALDNDAKRRIEILVGRDGLYCWLSLEGCWVQRRSRGECHKPNVKRRELVPSYTGHFFAHSKKVSCRVMLFLWLRSEFQSAAGVPLQLGRVYPSFVANLFLITRRRSVKFEAEIQRRLNSRAAKALCDSEVSALLDGVADILVGLSRGDALGLLSRAAFHIVSGEKSFYSRMQHISEGTMLECTAHTFFRRLETTGQYPDENADSRVRMKVQSLRTSIGKGRS